MAYDKAAFREEFTRRMREYNEAHGFQNVSATSLPARDEPHPGDSLGLERAARREWEQSAALRAEFGDCFERYLAFTKADRKGLVRIISRKP